MFMPRLCVVKDWFSIFICFSRIKFTIIGSVLKIWLVCGILRPPKISCEEKIGKRKAYLIGFLGYVSSKQREVVVLCSFGKDFFRSIVM